MSNITVVFRRVEINVLLFLTLKHAIQYITIESYSFSRSLLRDAFCYIPIRKSQCNASIDKLLKFCLNWATYVEKTTTFKVTQLQN